MYILIKQTKFRITKTAQTSKVVLIEPSKFSILNGSLDLDKVMD